MAFFDKIFGRKAGIPEVGPDFLPEKENIDNTNNERLENVEEHEETEKSVEREVAQEVGNLKEIGENKDLGGDL